MTSPLFDVRRLVSRKLPGQPRPVALLAAVRRRYNGGASIRKVAAELAIPYGTAHRLITESGATLRKRGGGHALRKAAEGDRIGPKREGGDGMAETTEP